MTTDFRALCAELLSALEDEAANWNLDPADHPLVDRARAALAAEPVPPGDGEVAELVAWLWSMHELAGEHNAEEQCRYERAADLLERLASPACVVVKPSPELIEAFKAAGPRWGHAPNA